jgi:hypothetical protein
VSGPIPWGALRAPLVELAPMLRRCQQLDPNGLARLVARGDDLALFAWLPFGVLAARILPTCPPAGLDVTARAADLLDWAAADPPAEQPPARCDEAWRGGLPPLAGWQRVETVGDEVIRPLVRAGALALKDAARRAGTPEASAPVAGALLDSVVLTATSGTRRAEVTLRLLSSLTRLGFLARQSRAHVDATAAWIRVAGAYGSVYAQTGPSLRL